jgi:hypothetical protein
VVRQGAGHQPEPRFAGLGAEAADRVAHLEEAGAGRPDRVDDAPVRRRERLVGLTVEAAHEQRVGVLERVAGAGQHTGRHRLLEGGRRRGRMEPDVADGQVPHGRVSFPLTGSL